MHEPLMMGMPLVSQPLGQVRPMLSVTVLPGYAHAVEASWQERSLCAQTDPEAFFPEKGE